METAGPVLTVIDGLILLVVIFSALVSAARGFTREMMGFLSFIVAGAAAYYLAHPASALFSVFDFKPLAVKTGFSVENVAKGVGGAAVFAVTWVLWSIFGIYVSAAVRSLPAVGPLDRVLGFGYGAGRGVLFCIGVFSAYTLFADRDYPEPLRKARLLWLLQTGQDALSHYMPPQTRHMLSGSYSAVSERRDESIDRESEYLSTRTGKPVSGVPAIEDLLRNR